MNCSECNKREASVFLKILSDYQLSHFHLCAECAKRKGLEVMGQPAFLLNALFSHLSELTQGMGGRKESRLICSGCGLDYEAFRKTGRLGCAQCYESFKVPLTELLVRMHGTDRHIGKRPLPPLIRGDVKWKAQVSAPRAAGAREAISDIAELEAALRRLLEKEDYEGATLVRDQLRRLKSQGKGKK